MTIRLLLVLVSIATLLTPTYAERRRHSQNDVYVGGYERQDGTYVQPHYRSKPNANQWDNYGYQKSEPLYNPPPNVNRGSDWYQPNRGRYSDDNKDNDYPNPWR